MANDEVEVVIWDPVGFGSSSFGHVSTIIRAEGVAVSYSLGPRGCDVRDPKDYIKDQWFRDGYGLVLKLTAKQLSSVVYYFRSRMSCEYAFVAIAPESINNCASPIQRALALAGVKLAGFSLMPKALGVNLVTRGLVSVVHQYRGGKVERRTTHMPWAIPSGAYPWASGQ